MHLVDERLEILNFLVDIKEGQSQLCNCLLELASLDKYIQEKTNTSISSIHDELEECVMKMKKLEVSLKLDLNEDVVGDAMASSKHMKHVLFFKKLKGLNK